MGKLRVYCLKTLKKLSIYPLSNTPSAPSAFNQRLPISYELGDRLYSLLHRGRLVWDEEDAEGEIAEDAVKEEIV